MTARRESVRVGAGAGYAGDRWEPALELVEKGGIDYLVFECLAERTIAREALTRLHNPELGYNPGLVERMRAVLPECLRRGVRIVTNMGAANPLAAARRIRQEAADLGINDVPCAVVLGMRNGFQPNLLKSAGCYEQVSVSPEELTPRLSGLPPGGHGPDVARSLHRIGDVDAYRS